VNIVAAVPSIVAARQVIQPYRLHYGLPASPASRLRAWSGALLVHGAAGLALLVAWPQASEYLEQAAPIAVRMISEAKPPEPVPPPPPPPRRPTPQVAQAQPVLPTPPLPQPLPQPAVVATAAASVSSVVAPPPVAAKAEPVVVPEAVRPAPPAPPAPEPLVEARFDADYLSNPKPAYPMASRRLGEAGVVQLRVHVGPEGQALKVELKRSSGFPRLDQSALDTVTRWHFVPARRGATPVASWVVVPIVFSLT